MRMHTWAWIAWLLAALIPISTTRNPLYLVLILLVLNIVYLLLMEQSDSSQEFVSPVKFMLFVVITASIFNAITNHYGETVLFTIPGRVPLVSGAVTLEAFAYGAINGLVLSGLLTTFSVLNLALPIRSLVHLIPRAFYPVAIITSIAVTFVPQTRHQLKQVREAQAVRGLKARGLRDWLPLMMPLLVGGLERSMQLAETMTARGFASAGAVRNANAYRLAVLMGLLLVLGGWVASLTPGEQGVGSVLLLAGFATVLAALWLIGRQTPRTSYKKETWHGRDLVLVLCALLALAPFVLPLPFINSETLYYSPYPQVSLPAFDPLIGVSTLGLLAPAILILVQKR